jgi:hypothetical protein
MGMNESEQDWGGPYLQAAFLCERLLQETDGVYTAIRIVDQITARATDEPSQPSSLLVPINLTLFLAFKTGGAHGTFDLTVVLEQPSGPSLAQRFTQPILFEGGENRGHTIIMPIAMSAVEEGLYWFDVYLGDRLVTRVPLQVLSEQP